jgi:hypothetical protein
MRTRLALAALLALLAACGSRSSGINPVADQREATQQQKQCADPKWKEAHLGVWYTVCRPNDALKD